MESINIPHVNMNASEMGNSIALLNGLLVSQSAPELVLFKQIPAIFRLLRNNPDKIISPAAHIFVQWMEKDIL